MTTTETTTSGTTAHPDEAAAVGAFAERVLADGAAAVTVLVAALGDRLGLFRALAGEGPLTPAQLAGRAGVAERYAAEWLGAMAAAGYVAYEPPGFRLPDAHVPVLAADDTPASLGSVLQWTLGVAPVLPAVVTAFRTGAGVPPEAYPADFWAAMERLGAPGYETALVPAWLPQVPRVESALRAGADVADVGCGAGRALVRLAREYPRSRFVGIDTLDAQLDRARANAAAAGVADRVRFVRADAAGGLGGEFDVVTAFDVLHDAVDPGALVAAILSALRPGGTFLCQEPAAGETAADNLTPVGALYYGVSVLYCLSTSLASGGAGLGSLGLPESRLTELCTGAGFATVRRLAVEDPLHALFEVIP